MWAATAGLLGIAAIGAAWAGHSTESAQLAADLRLAFQRRGMALKEAAAWMGISLPTLSAQLAGEEQMSAWRLAMLPVSVHVELALLRLSRLGYSIFAPGEMAQAMERLAGLVERRRDVVAIDFPERRRKVA
jgi:hypothetical protein